MFAQYSPLFASGLMSDSPTNSRSPSPHTRPRHHDSLPLTVNTSSTEYHGGVESGRSPRAHPDAFFLTFKPHRREVEGGRSFLSLDLAESQSMRSMSLRRKDTVTSKGTTAFGRSEPSSPSPHSSPVSSSGQPFSFAPFLPPPSPVTSLRRPSRETLRLPSPKPAPLMSLPEPPASAPAATRPKRPHRPSNLVLTLSAAFDEVGPASSCSSSSPSYAYHRPSHSAPSLTSPVLPQIQPTSPIISPTTASSLASYFSFPSPTFPTFSEALPSPPPPSTAPHASRSLPSPPAVPASPKQPTLKASPSLRSTATVNTRQRNRSAALAALEGRGPAASRRVQRRRTRPGNFMSMSDDEDDEITPSMDQEAMFKDVHDKLLWVLSEEEGVVLPSPNPSRREDKKASLSLETVVNSLPPPSPTPESTTPKTNSSSTGSSSTKRGRRSTIESFFSPLTNFIDFKDEESSRRSWLSFVEISS
ncbi:hypothetical protein C8Q75DRAFT_737494 [Abortiporus biennis]|nr:hypothetical protein C8Q75DRAFT_737494 [Abortiporus biennis]